MNTCFSIAWHIECLKNMNNHRVKLYQEIQDKQKQYERFLDECLFREKQIEEAVKRGKASFDSEKFLIKKGG